METTMITTRKLTTMGLMAAISTVLLFFIRFPIFPAATFLEYDPADIPLIIAAFLYGPINALVLTGVVCIIQGLTVSAASGIIGILMHFFATGSLVLVSGAIYKKFSSNFGASIAVVAGVIAMTFTMVVWNLIFTPIFMGAPREVVMAMIGPIIIPFNLIKAGANSIVAFMIYKAVGKRLLAE